MKLGNYLIIFILALILDSCSQSTYTDVPREEPCHICEADTLFRNIDSLWTADLVSQYGVSFKGIFSEGNNVIITGAQDYHSFVYAFDKITGERVWDLKIDHNYFASAVHNNGNLVLQSYKRVVLVDVINGRVVHDYTQESNKAGNTFGQLLGDHYYYTRSTLDEGKSWVVRSHVSDFQNWEAIYFLKIGEDTGGSRPNIQSYNLWVDPETGDSIIVMQHRMAFENRVDLLAWNMTKKKLIWKHDRISPSGNSANAQIKIFNGKAYFCADTIMYCVDIKTGNILWFHREGGIMFNDPIYAEKEGAIILKLTSDKVISFDESTGNILWESNSLGHTSVDAGQAVYHNSIIYLCTSHRLHAMSAITGKLLVREKSSIYGSLGFTGEVAIDHERGILFASDNKKIFAIKTLEP